MKPPLRTKSVGTKVSEAEYALLEERARGAGMQGNPGQGNPGQGNPGQVIQDR
jgi:hypothetical protein